MPVIRIQQLFYVGVSEIIDKLVDSISRLGTAVSSLLFSLI